MSLVQSSVKCAVSRGSSTSKKQHLYMLIFE
jgi:hypothetical protein